MIKIKVVGESMSPKYRDGDWLLARFWPDGVSTVLTQGLIGKAVLIQRESAAAGPGILQIKRLVDIERTEDGWPLFWVEGDNKDASTDSREWGWLAGSEVKGVVLFRYKRRK